MKRLSKNLKKASLDFFDNPKADFRVEVGSFVFYVNEGNEYKEFKRTFLKEHKEFKWSDVVFYDNNCGKDMYEYLRLMDSMMRDSRYRNLVPRGKLGVYHSDLMDMYHDGDLDEVVEWGAWKFMVAFQDLGLSLEDALAWAPEMDISNEGDFTFPEEIEEIIEVLNLDDADEMTLSEMVDYLESEKEILYLSDGDYLMNYSSVLLNT